MQNICLGEAPPEKLERRGLCCAGGMFNAMWPARRGVAVVAAAFRQVWPRFADQQNAQIRRIVQSTSLSNFASLRPEGEMLIHQRNS